MTWCGPAAKSGPADNRAIHYQATVLQATLPLFLGGGVGVVVTPTAVMAHNLRSRVIEWRNVANVAVEKELGYRIVVTWDVHGRRIRLYAPYSSLDREFDAKLQAIRAGWLGQYDWSHYDGSRHAPTDGRAAR